MSPRPRPGVLRSFYFDCDSTLSAVEGVDELTAGRPPQVRARVVALTRRAMEGTLELAEVYPERLALLEPSRAEVEDLGRRYVEALVPGAREVVAALRALGKRTGIVSGGLLPAVLRLSRELGIEDADVHAVAVEFDASGRYRGFDRASPLWRNGGKARVLEGLPASVRPLCFVGDGATDLETRAVADWMVGFGGVVRRPAVEQGADDYFAAAGLGPLLERTLNADELARLERAAAEGGPPP